MSTLEKPGIAWADQQPVRQPVRRCGFRELRPLPRRAEFEATIADLEGQIAGSTKPKPVEASGVPASFRPRREDRSPSSEQIAIRAYHLWVARASPAAPTGTTGSKPSGNSRPRPEGPGGTSLRPPGRAAVRGACQRVWALCRFASRASRR